ncbi:hypothetical protein [Scytonema sp. PRP1]|uniref:hypothetical protein n=1 Tax=Scytonema sp. PRP1 TaxID=3120513 RepID=UPI002FCF4E0C
MPNNKNSQPGKEILSPVLVILVAGSLSLAIVDKDNRPAYFDIVKIAIACSFGSTKSPPENRRNTNTPEDLDNSDTQNSSTNREKSSPTKDES